jgi:exopolysaccharide biosynthesis polyprenyl glycosylphosphotransferase
MVKDSPQLQDPVSIASVKHSTQSIRMRLLLVKMLGDVGFSYLGLLLAYYIRFETDIIPIQLVTGNYSLASYQPVLLLGVCFLMPIFFYLRFYRWRLLIRPLKQSLLVLQGTTLWFVAYLGTSVVLKFDPSISRMFMLLAWVNVTVLLIFWKFIVHRFIVLFNLSQHLSQNVLLVGWNDEAARLADSIYNNENHPYELKGIVDLEPTDEKRIYESLYPRVGYLENLESILRNNHVDILVVAHLDMAKEKLSEVAQVCERNYVSLKIIPSIFQIFVSGLRLETISGQPLLGIDELPVNQLFNQVLRRSVDIIGALVGLSLFGPIMLFFFWRVYRESPGPVLFKQERVGLNGNPFKMLKIRSMRLGSDKLDHLNQSTLRQDDRVLRVGALMRRWNIDELPQFWNVLVGDMSLVGPRPERNYHVEQLSAQIPHYNQRHLVKPGITGWAQVNGLRGDTSLIDRIRYDIYYIENWSVILDIYIMILTFFKRDNAY